MYRRYVNAIVEVEQVNAGLEQNACRPAREAELELSHQRLREVEQRQMLSDERQRLMQDMHDGLGSYADQRHPLRGARRHERPKVAQILKDCMDDLKLAIDSMEPVEADLLLLLATLRFRLEPRLEAPASRCAGKCRSCPRWAGWTRRARCTSCASCRKAWPTSCATPAPARSAWAPPWQGDGVQVSIEDNGQGFDVEKHWAPPRASGLHNQQRRAQA
jgi:signal transduction histidine kinase